MARAPLAWLLSGISAEINDAERELQRAYRRGPVPVMLKARLRRIQRLRALIAEAEKWLEADRATNDHEREPGRNEA